MPDIETKHINCSHCGKPVRRSVAFYLSKRYWCSIPCFNLGRNGRV